MNTKEKLEKLADLQEQQEVLKAKLDTQKQAMIDSVYTPEIREAVKAIEAEFAPKYDIVDRLQPKIDELTAEIKAEVIASQATVKGTRLQMVFVKGRTTWETKNIENHLRRLLATLTTAITNCAVIVEGITDPGAKLAVRRLELDLEDAHKEALAISECEKTGDPSASLRKVA